MLAERTDAMRLNSPPSRHRRWRRLPQQLLRGFVLGLTLGLALTSVGLMH